MARQISARQVKLIAVGVEKDAGWQKEGFSTTAVQASSFVQKSILKFSAFSSVHKTLLLSLYSAESISRIHFKEIPLFTFELELNLGAEILSTASVSRHT